MSVFTIVGKLEKPQAVRDRASVLADHLGDIVDREPELVLERLIAARLLDRVQILALEILHERVPERLGVVHLADDRRDRRPSRELRRAEPPLAEDELVAVSRAPDDDRLQDAVQPDRLGELPQVLVVEMRARLMGIRIDPFDVEILHAFRLRDALAQILRDQRLEPAPEHLLRHFGLPPPFARLPARLDQAAGASRCASPWLSCLSMNSFASLR